jgi:hypothetical protein
MHIVQLDALCPMGCDEEKKEAGTEQQLLPEFG